MLGCVGSSRELAEELCVVEITKGTEEIADRDQELTTPTGDCDQVDLIPMDTDLYTRSQRIPISLIMTTVVDEGLRVGRQN